ncbi:MAG: RnfH family protein [Zetaproteobacteria bacterium CG12_big_fil_rev_8_21_14_0_65_54_13]|nr:MAG: RnfH family protein [Zetaproteobacteria bacterium CG12_big_fil_rev_8_21_14_0_65_54_13]PJA30105.1 MAG: RnfH family protein [Zetaproteobacteria bacterium CG_4_9_14_3_um_filter_54_145]
MNVSLAFVEGSKQIWQKLDIPEGSTIRQVILISGILDDMPHIDLETHKVGIYGKIAELTDTLKEGDRVEIYRPITADPATVKRRKIVANDD